LTRTDLRPNSKAGDHAIPIIEPRVAEPNMTLAQVAEAQRALGAAGFEMTAENGASVGRPRPDKSVVPDSRIAGPFSISISCDLRIAACKMS
jgi:hypothetical protein